MSTLANCYVLNQFKHAYIQAYNVSLSLVQNPKYYLSLSSSVCLPVMSSNNWYIYIFKMEGKVLFRCAITLRRTIWKNGCIIPYELTYYTYYYCKLKGTCEITKVSKQFLVLFFLYCTVLYSHTICGAYTSFGKKEQM